MRKLFYVFLCGACATACIDKDFDLKNIDTDNIAIGDETSCFEVPLVKVHITMDDINSNDGVRIDDIFTEADTWLPTQLPDQDENGYYADVQRMLTDTRYVNEELLPRLIAQMESDPAKLDDVASLIQEKYYASFSSLLPGISQEEFKAAFIEGFNSDDTLRDLLVEEVKNLAGSYLTELDVDMDNLAYDVEHIDISDDIVDMLADNLDPAETVDPKNTLHLAGTIDNRLPVTLQIDPSFEPTSVTIATTTIAANKADNELPETRLYAEDLRTLVRGITIQIPVVIEKYYPGKGFESEAGENAPTQLAINLHLIKRGALKFDL